MSTGKELHFNLKLDLADPDDEAIADLFSSVPNGFREAVLRSILKKSMPKNQAEMKDLLWSAVEFRSTKGKARGRKKREMPGSEDESKSHPLPNNRITEMPGGTPKNEAIITGVAEIDSNQSGRKTDARKFSGLIGGTTWTA